MVALRLAGARDVAHVNALVARSINALHVDHYSAAEIEAAVRLAYGVDWQLIRDRTYYVAELDGIVVGAGGWSFRQKIGGGHGPEEAASSLLDPLSDAARIRAFYVDPGHARHGIGSQLLLKCEDAARHARFPRIELTSTLQAVPFYLRHGYRVVGPVELPFAEEFMLRAQLMTKGL